MTTYWNIDSADGTSLTQGLRTEPEARRAAQNIADQLCDPVYLYEVGGGDGESEVESEEIKPRTVRCECGEWSGERCNANAMRDDMVTVEYMPDHLRSSHQAAGNTGTHPVNGSVRILVTQECADAMIEHDGDWVSVL